MAFPATSTRIVQPMDPSDIVDFAVTLTQGTTDQDVLEVGEGIDTFTLVPLAEATAAGLVIKQDVGYPAPIKSGLSVLFWLAIADASQADSAFDRGVDMGIVLTVTTDAVPPRVFQRTVVVTVVNL